MPEDAPLLERALASGLRDLEVEASAAQQEAMLAYLRALLRTNERLNLTRIVDPLEGVRLHLLDSLAAAPELAPAPAGHAIDIGSGGGFPGVPLAIVSGRRFTLLDSIGKKATAVQGILDELAERIPAAAISARAEEIARTSPACYSVAVARAVAPLPSLVELAAPLLQDRGRLIALKGQPSETEMLSGLLAAEIVGMRMASRRQLRLPGSAEHRTILVFEKVGPPRVALPRRTGLAQHQPLA